MVIDINKCGGCYGCFIACKDEHCGQEYPGYSAPQPMMGQFWMNVIEKERGTYPKVKTAHIAVPCMHCEDAPCVAKAKDGAVYRREDGIVIIDPVKAKGQKQIVTACPYRVIYWNEELNLPQKCTFCANLIDEGWKEPRCVEMCPADALMFGDLDDPNSEVSKLIKANDTESFRPEFGLKESVFYINLPKKFIAGTVADAESDEVAPNVTVTVSGEGKKFTQQTNGFGDFEFEGLADNKTYTVTFAKQGYATQEMQVKTSRDLNLGVIMMQK
jgi:Fe-S-cluster-containing dehydrogenase component